MAAIPNVAVPSKSLVAVSRSPAAPPKSAVSPLNAIVENAASSAVRSSMQEQSGLKVSDRQDDQSGNMPVVQTGRSWGFVFDTLNSEIKLRDYSPKTLKDYRALTRQDGIDFFKLSRGRKTGFLIQFDAGILTMHDGKGKKTGRCR